MQLKPVCAIVFVTGVKVLCVETQILHSDITCHWGTRPIVSSAADVTCYALIVCATEVAEARGGVCAVRRQR